MGGMGSVVKGQGAVGGRASKVGHCGHGVWQRTLHTPGARPLQQSTSTTRNRSAGRSQGAAEKKINRGRHPGNGTQIIEQGHREERRERGERAERLGRRPKRDASRMSSTSVESKNQSSEKLSQ